MPPMMSLGLEKLAVGKPLPTSAGSIATAGSKCKICTVPVETQSKNRLGACKLRSEFVGQHVARNKAGSVLARSLINRHEGTRAAPLQSKATRTTVASATTAHGVSTGAQHVGAEAISRGHQWSVHKFGGTCMGNAERIANVAKIAAEDPATRKAVVVSAMATVTDMLYDAISHAEARDKQYLKDLDTLQKKHEDTARALLRAGPELDRIVGILRNDIEDLKALLKAIWIAGSATDIFVEYVVGHGELWSSQILAAVLNANGTPASWMDARDVLVVEPVEGNQVDPLYPESNAGLDKWAAAQKGGVADVVIITGFIASTTQGRPTTLRRDGSDFSAAIFASLLEAKQLTIWTDVNGVYSADPRKVDDACVLEAMTYQEAWEMSYFGANVLHPRTTLPVIRSSIPITIRNFFNTDAPGTVISSEGSKVDGKSRTGGLVKGFATIDNVTLINVEGAGMVGVPGTASAIFTAVKDTGANVIMISQASSEHSLCFAVPSTDAAAAVKAVKSIFKQALESGRIAEVGAIPNCSVLAVVGQRMAHSPGVAANIFSALAKANINIRAIAQGSSEYNVTVVVDQSESIRALRVVHSRFYVADLTIALGVIGPGNIGRALINQIESQAATLREKFKIDLRVLGISDSRRMLLLDGGDLENWEERMKTDTVPVDMATFAKHLDNYYIPNMCIVDNTASAFVADHYIGWLQQGIHIVTPNKKMNSGDLVTYRKLRELQRTNYTHYFYEATVGAGLPIISTIRSLLETGDNMITIEGIFSGTLSFIFNTFSPDQPFSSVVKKAKEAGYTEPDPRDDLNGLDVARKVVILARECGLDLALEDVPIDSLVPMELAKIKDVDEFMARLPEYDHVMADKAKAAGEKGMVLRLVGVVDCANKQGRVELREYPKSHAFANLSGTDNIISFTTERYFKQALIVRGPGAGPEVTAAGVFGDILRLAAYLGAPS
eukprot:jgi/Mesvir1/24793/Mv22045-RA.1